MEDFGPSAAYTSYSVSNFAVSREFYEVKLGCTAVREWDRADGQGVYYQLGAIPVAEILASGGDQAPLVPPAAGSFSIVVIVSDAHSAHDALLGRGARVTTPPVTEHWGTYFGVDDPDGVPLYFVEQAASA